jgi:hypothetical protein
MGLRIPGCLNYDSSNANPLMEGILVPSILGARISLLTTADNRIGFDKVHNGRKRQHLPKYTLSGSTFLTIPLSAFNMVKIRLSIQRIVTLSFSASGKSVAIPQAPRHDAFNPDNQCFPEST